MGTMINKKVKLARTIVDSVIADLSDRNGYGQWGDEADPIISMITNEWKTMVLKALYDHETECDDDNIGANDKLYGQLRDLKELTTYKVNEHIGQEGMLPLYEDPTGSWVALGDVQFVLNGGVK